jgi:hypothetical protein
MTLDGSRNGRCAMVVDGRRVLLDRTREFFDRARMMFDGLSVLN